MVPLKYIKHNPSLFAQGKRGLIYTFKKGRKLIALKVKNPKSEAINRIENEINFLKILNKYNIGPKILDYGKDYFCYEFIDGITLKEYLKKIKNPKRVLERIMRQCEVMDKLKINKEEMHIPLKNIIVKNSKPILLDFERCHFTTRPKNVNQFREFLRRFRF